MKGSGMKWRLFFILTIFLACQDMAFCYDRKYTPSNQHVSLQKEANSVTNAVVGKIEDDFCVTPMGQACYEIPIPALPGTGGVVPKLSITYCSSTKNGLLGYGFDLTGLSIISRTGKNLLNDSHVGSITFTSDDRFVLDGARLILVQTISSTKRIYFTENNSFSRITAYGQEANPSYFTVETKDGLFYEYYPNTKILDPQSAEPGLFWMLTKVTDTKGNYFSVTYSGDNTFNDIYPLRIDYTGNDLANLSPYASIRFCYENNSASVFTYIHGKIVRRTKYISEISLFSDETLVRRLNLSYQTVNHKKQLISVIEETGDHVQKRPTNFQWYNETNLAVTGMANCYVSNLRHVTLTVGDYNGDGKADFLATSNSDDAPYQGWQLYLSNGNTFSNAANGQFPRTSGNVIQTVSGDFNGDGYDDIAMVTSLSGHYYTDVKLSTGCGFGNYRPIFNDSESYMISATEANGDGQADIFAWFTGSRRYTQAVSNSSGTNLNFALYTGTCSEQWGMTETGDFNGDGLTDILNRYNSGGRMMIANGCGGFSEQSFSYGTNYDISLGDFNGDGKTDFLIGSWNGTEWSCWWLAYSDGAGMLRHVMIDTPFQARDKQVFVVDANGDGLDDFYAIDKLSSGYNMTQPRLYLNNGADGFAGQNAGSNVYATDKWNFYFGDFSGDGKTDFVCTSNWTTTSWNGYKLYLLPQTPNLLLAQITDGMGNSTSITYKNMSDASVHERGTTGSYPLSSFSSSWPVVHQVTVPDGIGGIDTTSYYYENALLHRGGRGVLGFAKVSSTCLSTERRTESSYYPCDYYYFMEPRQTEEFAGNVRVAWKDYFYGYPSMHEPVTSRNPISTIDATYDYATGTLTSYVRTNYEYDAFGNTTKTTAVGGGSQVVTTCEFQNDSVRWILGRMTRSTVTKSGLAGMETTTRLATFDYEQASGLLTAEHSEPNNYSLGYSKSYVRDVYGNIVQSTTQPNDTNTPSRTEITAYDSRGRFIYSHTDALGHTQFNNVSQHYGLLLSTTDANGITVTNTYDSFGRCTATYTPISATHTTTGWSSGVADAPSYALYYVLTQATGIPDKLDFYDCKGRMVRTVTENVSGQKIYSDVVYNHKGQVEKTSEPYFANDVPIWNINTYDITGRILSQTDANGHTTTYTYNNRTTTVTDALGHSIARTVDIKGNLIQSCDEGGSIAYEYDLDGHCTRLVGSRSTVSMEYDIMGNRTQMHDPELGTVSSVYNAYGELVSQTDGNGTTTYTYDQGGRVTAEARPDVTFTSAYDTRFVGALSSVSASNGTSVEYYYDSYGRDVSQTVSIGGMQFSTQTTYDQQGHIATITYPSGLSIGYDYAYNGLLHDVSNAVTGESIWQVDAQNARGQTIQQTLGNGLSTLMTYDVLGRTTSVNTGGVQAWSYAYDAVGDLTQRQDGRHGLTETFDYDRLNRLTKVYRNGDCIQRVTYDAAGNILSKTGTGHDFVYADGTNRLVSFYADSPMPRLWDDIQYTSFHKVRYIRQGQTTLTLTYGPDKSRCKTVTDKGGITETKYYVGNLYEQTVRSGETVSTCYIYAGGKAIAIYETSSLAGVRLFYLHHDHLGSVQAYTDESGTLVQELSYDAWGRRRDPATWEYYDRIADAEAANPWGFTGHEHLDIFELVNMDGRMYDPVLGRFLTPDPFVQAPDFTQGLNRYSYCLNNPLSLTDPTGYSWLSRNWKSLVASAVGIAVSAITAGGASTLTVAIIAGAAGGAAGALTGALLNGANIGQIAKTTFTGAFWGAASGLLNFLSADEMLFAKIFKHTFSQGFLEGVQGGNMLHGLMMGATSGAGGYYINEFAGSLGKVGKIAANTILNGTVDKIGGGKFANGAITGAFSIMFNDMMHSIQFEHISWKKVFKELRQLYTMYDESSNPELYNKMGGTIRTEVYVKNRNRASNACALKLCIALEKAGFFIPEGTKSLKAGNGKNYFVSAAYFYEFLKNNYKNNTHNFISFYDLKRHMSQGIYYQHGNWNSPAITGHIDAMYNGNVGGTLYKKQRINVGFY